MKKIRCKIFGCNPINLNTQKFSADCARCNRRLEVSYDMAYGETIITN